MLSIYSNFQSIISRLSEKVKSLGTTPDILHSAAESVVEDVRKRIYTDGQDVEGNAIGNYTPEYMRVRTGVFKRDGLIYRSGKSKGQAIPQGLFTKGKNKGQARPQYGLSGDTKIILTLTGAMRDDLSVQPSDSGFGIGFSSTELSNRSEWLEEKYSKNIFSLTDSERSTAIAAAQEKATQILGHD